MLRVEPASRVRASPAALCATLGGIANDADEEGREVARLARFRIDPAGRDELLAAYARYAEAVRSQAGVLVWEMCTDADDRDLVWLFVRATDAEALEAHRNSAAAAEWRSAAAGTRRGSEFHDLVPHFSNRP